MRWKYCFHGTETGLKPYRKEHDGLVDAFGIAITLSEVSDELQSINP